MNQKLVVKKAFHLYQLFYKKIYYLSQRLTVQNASSARNSVSFETNPMILQWNTLRAKDSICHGLLA